VLGEGGHAKVAQHINALRCGAPEVTFAILEELVYIIARQAVCAFKVIDVCAVNSVDTLIECSDPEIALAVNQEGLDRQGFAVQFWNHERLHHAVYYVLQTSSVSRDRVPNPDRAICGNREAPHAGGSLMGLQGRGPIDFD
jgi:hypothetical protein